MVSRKQEIEEQLKNGKIIKMVIKVPPRTKKNHGRIIENKQNHKKFMLPSEQYVQYEKDCCYFVSPKHVKIDIPLNIKCLYYMPTKGRVDKTNLESAVMDMLVHYGVIKDDNSTIVVSTDGSRVKYDKENPRTEIYISYQPNL